MRALCFQSAQSVPALDRLAVAKLWNVLISDIKFNHCQPDAPPKKSALGRDEKIERRQHKLRG